ncbi:MAG: hypothetical protein EZS28_007519 [Streblomastix strix]|uniref:Uncharacterized protein n=1 Tax=Streblomastix strix TaxID=222440 RepID=A0A5J4WPB4_9EUKA|nr:MAG: hypothetical protein EZS28_007519 [Streblomastix strix]
MDLANWDEDYDEEEAFLYVSIDKLDQESDQGITIGECDGEINCYQLVLLQGGGKGYVIGNDGEEEEDY